MNQPDFGKELAKIRKSNGLTQHELAEKSDVSYRTIQRIESGMVTPRSFTIKTLSKALRFDFLKEFPFESSENVFNKNHRFILSKKIISQTIDLFNLKTNAMKKLSVLSLIFGFIGFGLFVISNNSFAQGNSKLTNFLTVETNKVVSQKEAIKLITEIDKEAKYHDQSMDMIKTYAKKSDYNFDTYVHLTKLIGSFGHSTQPVMEIANIVFLTHEDCDLFNDIASLIFLNNHNTDLYVKLAKDARDAKSDDDFDTIKEQITKYKDQADFKTLDEAFNDQKKI